MDIRTATTNDAGWLAAHDPAVDKHWVARCITQREYLVAAEDNEPVGFLRFSRFWGAIPYMDMIWVSPDRRGQGLGSALRDNWEQTMTAEGATLLLTSAQVDEPQAVAWHQRHGYTLRGTLDLAPLQSAAEVVLAKTV